MSMDPDDRLHGARGIVRTLEAAVRAGRPETSRGGARTALRLEAFVERLTRQIETHLAVHRFLRLQVTPEGLRVEGLVATRPGGRRNLAAALLHAGQVVEIVFKEGAEREEILRLVGVLHRCPDGIEAAESVATMLWQCDMHRISFRCRDDFWLDRSGSSESFDVVNSVVSHADELAPDSDLDPPYSSAKGNEAFPDLDLDEPTAPLRRVFQADAEDPVAVRFPPAAATLGRIADLLSGIQLAEDDTGAKSLARDALLRVVDLQLSTQDLTAVRETLRKLRPAASHATAYATLRALGERVCGPKHVQLLAALLHPTQSSPAQIALVQDILRLLGDEGIHPLWQQLEGAKEPETREPVIRVLASLCADDPHALAQYVDGNSVEMVRDFIHVLARISGVRVLAPLGRWKRHGDVRIRLEVVRALHPDEVPGATTMLCELLDDSEQRVRQSAVWSLAARRDVRALPKLRQLVFEDQGFRDRSESERDDFFRALGRLADAATLEELAGMMERRSWPAKGWTAELRRGAAIALGDSSWPQARKLLEKYTRSRDARLRAVCLGAVRGIQSAQHVETEARPEETEHVGRGLDT